MKRTMFVVLLAVVALSLMATSAFAAPSDGPKTVTITGSVNKAVSLTILTPVVTFGPIDPGTFEDQTASIEVRSNFDYIINRVPDAATFAANGFSLQTPGFATGGDQVKTGSTPAQFDDVYRFSATWDMTAGTPYSSSVDYTVIAK